MDQQALDLVNAQQVIESRPLSYWQKYVKGVNMSFINCELSNNDCVLPKSENKFYVYAHHMSVSLSRK